MFIIMVVIPMIMKKKIMIVIPKITKKKIMIVIPMITKKKIIIVIMKNKILVKTPMCKITLCM